MNVEVTVEDIAAVMLGDCTRFGTLRDPSSPTPLPQHALEPIPT